MVWFGKSEEELKEWGQDLDVREKTLNQLQDELDRKMSELNNREKISQEMLEELTSKDSDLCSREKDLVHRELNAKNTFVKEQREAFTQAIEVQVNELDLSEKQLREKQKNIESRFAELKKLDGELAQRERAIKEAEIAADNGFAEKNRSALREIEQRETLCREFEQILANRENKLLQRHQELEKSSEKLREREESIREAEIKRDEGFVEYRKKLDDELAKKRSDFLEEISTRRKRELNTLETMLAEEERSRLASLDEELTKLRQQHKADVTADREKLSVSKQSLMVEKAQLDELKEELEYQKQRLQSRRDVLEERESNLNAEVDVKVEERKITFESEKSAFINEISRLRESIKVSSALISNFEELKQKLGDDDPAVVLLNLKTYEEEITKLREELASRPTREMEAAFDRIKSDKDNIEAARVRLQGEIDTLKRSAREQSELELQITDLTDENKSWRRRYDAIDADNNRLSEDLRRIKASYEREEDRDARIKDIEVPYIQKTLPRKEKVIDELQWLDRIGKGCADYGIKFPKRILHAFHTSLKTSEWSPITVLAGASGTGKSELPRLYSHFGGINFLSLSVQPNWDSQESMLGFFNSIDNKFDTQPVLRLLAQSQKKQTEEYPFGLHDVMNIILMDEMNLAYVELYFAEFLSKLELRRGRKGLDVPHLEVKLGAGIQHYELPLGRNVLWAGTMNQDETTKSLSDKVLDRGIIINFPRPTHLERRKQLRALGDQAPLLPRKHWQSWWCTESVFTDQQIMPFKCFVEDMNESLSKVGRALGHRVWQSIEYYMANYPEVLEAQRTKDESLLAKSMKIAFEDQLVQKVMPKLRGIETRGRGKTECLDKIKTQLVDDDYAIVDDFNLACEFGYGQFIWSSANYLKDDEPVVIEESADQDSEPPQAEKPTSDDSSEVSDVDFGVRAGLAKKLSGAGYRALVDVPVDNAKDLKTAGFNMTEIAEIRRALSENNA